MLFRGMSESETKSHRWRREFSHPANTHSSLAKQSNNAMMSSISPSEEQPSSKAKKSWKSLYDERMSSLRTEGLSSNYDHPEITHPDVNFTPCPRNDMSRKASSASPTRPMSDGITMGASSTFDRLMTSMSKQKGGGSSSTRLQSQLTSSSLGLTPPFGATGDISDMFAGVMNGLDELRRDMTKRIDQVDERAHQGRENLRDELTHVKSQARVDQAQLIRNTDQCLAESLAQANKESEEREARMTREIERLLNDHDNTYAHTMTSLEKRLDAKSDLMMRKLEAILEGRNWEERSNPRERSRESDLMMRKLDAILKMEKLGGAFQPKGALTRMEMIRAVMPGPSKVQERTTNLGIGSGQGQPRRDLAGRIRSRRRQMLLRRQGCQLCHKSVQCQI